MEQSAYVSPILESATVLDARISDSALGLPLQRRAQQAESSQILSSLDQRLGAGCRYIGKIQPRHARDISAPNWSIGAEMIDRDYTIYPNWRGHLGPLDAMKAWIQSGWAKSAKQLIDKVQSISNWT